MNTKLVKTLAAAIAAFSLAGPAAAQWKPSKPINIIVPWAAGGATDQVTRVAAGELEEALGAKNRGDQPARFGRVDRDD